VARTVGVLSPLPGDDEDAPVTVLSRLFMLYNRGVRWYGLGKECLVVAGCELLDELFAGSIPGTPPGLQRHYKSFMRQRTVEAHAGLRLNPVSLFGLVSD
jgi:hypothetical protein